MTFNKESVRENVILQCYVGNADANKIFKKPRSVLGKNILERIFVLHKKKCKGLSCYCQYGAKCLFSIFSLVMLSIYGSFNCHSDLILFTLLHMTHII